MCGELMVGGGVMEGHWCGHWREGDLQLGSVLACCVAPHRAPKAPPLPLRHAPLQVALHARLPTTVRLPPTHPPTLSAPLTWPRR